MKTNLLLFILTLFLFACGAEEMEEANLFPPEKLEFPDCQLILEDFRASYGFSESTTRAYQAGKITSQVTIHNYEHRSEKGFIYDSAGFPAFMIKVDSTEIDTLASFSYEDGLLTNYRHLKDGSVLSARQFIYENEHLSKIIAFNGAGSLIEMEVKTDTKGNPIRLSYELDGSSIEVRYEYDDNFNPYYRMPDFIDESKYFAQNNLLKLTVYQNGGESHSSSRSYTYDSNGFPSSMTDKFSQGIHSFYFHYECAG